MVASPTFDRLDYSAGVAVVVLLIVAYLIYPHTILQYAVWLTIFTIWMAWFVYFGTKWMYGIEK